MTKLIGDFRNFKKAPKNVYSLIHLLQLTGDNGLENVTVNTDIFTVYLQGPYTVIPYVCPPDAIPFTYTRDVRKVKNVCTYNPRGCFIVPDQSFGVFSRV